MSNAVDHPPHYAANGYEAIDIIEAYALNFSAGNAVKYILRAGRKDAHKAAEDFRKAAWYCAREADRIERKNGRKRKREGKGKVKAKGKRNASAKEAPK